MIVKNQRKDKSTKATEVLKTWKEHFKQHLNTEFTHDENILHSIPYTTPDSWYRIINKRTHYNEKSRKENHIFT